MTADRATTPVVGVVLLVALTVMAAIAVGSAALALDPPSDPSIASFSLTVDASSETLTIRHRSGATVRGLRVVVTIAGRTLDHQPPVQFFAAEGFRSGPTGPFNSGADPDWTAGERGTIRLATTNDPLPDTGDRVTVRLVDDGTTIETLRTTAS